MSSAPTLGDDVMLHARLDGFVARLARAGLRPPGAPVGSFLDVPAAGPPDVATLLSEVRDLLRAFQVAEARHVRLGLADADFAFEAAQERLGFLRSTFAAIVSVASDGLAEVLPRIERQELERIALLARSAPLTSADDLAAMRAARQRRAAVA